MQRREIEYFAPVDGVAFALLRPGDDPLQQKTAHIVNQGDQLDLTVWVRAVYGDDHVEDLLRSGYDFPPAPQLHSEEAVVLTHTGPNSENTIAFDQHIVFDADTDRLWMVWGGTQIYVSEMHPQNGRLIDDPRDPEYRTHPDSIYTMVANFNGDEWTGKPEDGSEYFEGPALLKYGGYWYLFYVGYDYRNRKVPGGAPEPRDIMGIRKMYFVNDWPTIWVPITVSRLPLWKEELR